jgi:arylsulfatase A-like enzyme
MKRIALVVGLAWSISVAAEKPNIIFIITDDQGWGDIGYNNPNVYTPNLDKLAKSGTVFTQHYVMPQCTPSRIAAFTGRYPGRFGPNGLQATSKKVFPVGTKNVASVLKSAGYATYQCGKWHMGTKPEDGPNHHGFDQSYGTLDGACGAYDHRYRGGKQTWHRNLAFIPGAENGRHVTDLISEEAIRIIQEKKTKPFFLYLAFTAPHTPLDERGTFVDQPTQLDPNNPQRWMNEDKITWFNDPEGKIQKEKDPEKRLLLAVVHHLDDAIGKVIKSLEESGQREKTLILFSSDNGPQVSWSGNAYPSDLKLTDFNQPIPFRGSKCDTYEGGIRVPGFANWPGTVKAQTISTPVHIVDWLPTVAALGGVPKEKCPRVDGTDISPLLFNTGNIPPRDFYWVWGGPKGSKWALRDGDLKIVYNGKEPGLSAWSLYNLSQDKKETKDLSKEHPDTVQALHKKFLTQRTFDTF